LYHIHDRGTLREAGDSQAPIYTKLFASAADSSMEVYEDEDDEYPYNEDID
jgi:hypothetical protein